MMRPGSLRTLELKRKRRLPSAAARPLHLRSYFLRAELRDLRAASRSSRGCSSSSASDDEDLNRVGPRRAVLQRDRRRAAARPRCRRSSTSSCSSGRTSLTTFG